jgi:hypothetical protein
MFPDAQRAFGRDLDRGRLSQILGRECLAKKMVKPGTALQG